MHRLIAALLLASAAAECGRGPALEPATLVLRGGRIITVDETRPDAEAMAARGDRIVAIGSPVDVQTYIGPQTEVIDLSGLTAVPGFIDAHAHFLGLGGALQVLDLRDAASWAEIVSIVRTAAARARPGEWIRGRGWHQEKWTSAPQPAVEGFPVHDALTSASPDNPVFLEHASGHAGFVNARALAAAGINASTPNPPGGEILKDRAGRPTGLLRETASTLAEQAVADWLSKRTPDEQAADARRTIQLAVDESLRNGITTIHDAGESFAAIDVLKQAAAADALGIRLWVMVLDSNEAISARMASYKAVGLADNHLTIAAIKKSIDGALGSRGAWLLEPYNDQPSSTGLNTASVEEVRALASLAAANGVQLAVHAIGDRANREVLDIYAATFAANPDVKDWRWRIEHAQHLHTDDISRFARLGVIASMQGIHATSDAPFVRSRLGEARASEGAYVWRKLIETEAVIANGTDAPVERLNPIQNLHASITRKLRNGTVFYPLQRMSRAEALRSYTYNAAYAAKEEHLKGSLAVGKLADVTVLNKDIMTIPDDDIPSTQIAYTIVGGRVMYRASDAGSRRR
jgi:predicted amidohydrolase YtcJ